MVVNSHCGFECSQTRLYHCLCRLVLGLSNAIARLTRLILLPLYPSCSSAMFFLRFHITQILTDFKGRSPYEPPETAAVDTSSPVRRVSNIHADNYMQQYDARGHPVNIESKTLGKELRRAKNDILSTMGIVVSGEDHKARTSSEQQKIDQIASENDLGLVITTLDQFFVFLGTWWTSSLTGRIQVRPKSPMWYLGCYV